MSLVLLASKYVDLIVPGYTHLQRAQPVLLPHLLLSYVEQVNFLMHPSLIPFMPIGFFNVSFLGVIQGLSMRVKCQSHAVFLDLFPMITYVGYCVNKPEWLNPLSTMYVNQIIYFIPSSDQKMIWTIYVVNLSLFFCEIEK